MVRAFVGCVALWGAALFLGAAFPAPARGRSQAASEAAAPEIPNAKTPLEGLLSGGQPTPEQLEQAARVGFETVINLRTDGEPGFEWEAQKVESLGLRYVRIPIGGAPDLTRANAQRLDDALRDALGQGPVLMHCSSGNRNGALLALREAWIRGAAPEAALALGSAAGLTRLEAEVRRLLDLPPAPAAAQ